MLQQVLRLARNALALQVVGRCNNNRLPLQQGACHDVGIKILARHHDGHIIFIHPRRGIGVQVDVKQQLGEFRMPQRHHGRQKVGRQHRRRNDADGAAQIARVGRRCRFGVVDLVQDGAYALQIGITRVGERQLAGSALQQPRAQMLLQLGHHAGDHRG
ncbi:hypothetical protein D3C71_1505230 [compost metagenome]